VQTLEAIGEIDLPQPPDSCDIARVAAAKVLHKSLSGLRHSVNTLDAEASVPPDPNLSSQLSGVSKAKAAMAEMLQLQREVAELKVQQKQTDKDLDSVLADLSSIPSCPTCSRPVACKPHDHA
jgi:seryl-tRNA synthetase